MNLKTNRRIYALLPILLLVTACEKEVYVDIPGIEPRLVVNAFLVEGKPIEVHISSSAYITDLSAPSIENATVTLYANGSVADTLTHSGNGTYRSALIARTNNEYGIVAHADGYPEVSALDRIPSIPRIVSTTRTDNIGANQYGQYFSQLRVKLQDDANDKNYYQMQLVYHYDYELFEWLAEVDTSYVRSGTTSGFSDITGSDNPSFIVSNIFFSAGGYVLFTDDLFDGKEFAFSIYYRNAWTPSVSPDYTLYIHLRSVSESYYNHSKSYYQYAQSSPDLWNNPGEEVRLYSNIENGFGIFAGYSAAIDTIPNPMEQE